MLSADFLVHYILLTGGATVLATQLLKSRFIPIQFEKYPQWTAAAVSLIASIIVEIQAHIAIDVHNIPALASLFVGTLWVAISVYNHLTPVNKV